ncbi:MAG TPA: hypothetical protein VKM55_09250 [Candidatus Lokiarchaeia archaeon]|nr:hypothetical protein [Candidatus Lokiarchaeia archaeon]
MVNDEFLLNVYMKAHRASYLYRWTNCYTRADKNFQRERDSRLNI